MRPPRPAGPSFRFFRYQFDTAAQLRRHCRLIDGRVLLFFPFPDDEPTPSPRSRALIEICFVGSGQQTSLSAVVHPHEGTGVCGSWLELRALSVVAGLQSAIAMPKRWQRRLALDQLAWVSHADGPVLSCPVLDISRGGARLWGIPGALPSVGEPLRMRLPESPTLVARIVWAHGREVGIAFAPESLRAADEIYARVEELWASARVARHQPDCTCDPLDPPAPVRLSGGSR